MREAKVYRVDLKYGDYRGIVYADDLPEYIQQRLGLEDAILSVELDVVIELDRNGNKIEAVLIDDTNLDILKYCDLYDLQTQVRDVQSAYGEKKWERFDV